MKIKPTTKLNFSMDGGSTGILSLLDQTNMPEADKVKVREALNGVSMSRSDKFSVEVNERLDTAGEHAQKMIESVAPAWPVVSQLIKAAYAAQTSGKRVLWLIKAADALANTYGPVSACKSGCSHCCHIPVNVTKAEADALGKTIGRKPVPAEIHQNIPDGDFSPCCFLVDNKCSIYAHRPAVCRAHMNMDKDDLLCRLVPGLMIPVPYLDTRPIAMARMVTGGNLPSGDIRQWFPIVTSY